MENPIWGIDLGGTKIEGAILKNASNPTTIARLRLPTEQEKGYHHILNQIAEVVNLLKEESGLTPKKIGIGTPGTIDPATGLLKNSNTVCLNGQPLKKDLEELIQIPLEMANDANCFAVAETTLGAVKQQMPNARVVFGIIMGTGVGGGLVVNGQVINGKHGIGGEWGHIFLDASGGPCYCGKIGCAERILSGPSLEKFYSELSGEKIKLPQIISRHLSKTDAAATQTVERLLYFFGKGISYIINIIDPDVIVLGGGLGNIDFLYTEGIQSTLPHIFNPVLQTPLLKPMLGDSAGVFGAALLTV
jgi:fructokinase